MNEKQSIWQSHSFIAGILIVVVSLGFISIVAPAVEAISVEGMPDWEAQLVYLSQMIVKALPPGVMAAFGWTLFGYLRYKSGDSAIQYDLTKMSETVAWFLAFILPLTYASNTPLAVFITVIISGVKSVLSQVIEKMTHPAPTSPNEIVPQSTGPGPPATA
jgi:hypothetical protein